MSKGINTLIIASGSIGILQLPQYINWLKYNGYSCKCVMTKSAADLLPPTTVSTMVDTYTDNGSWGSFARVPHIALGDWAKLVLVIPASANIISKVAHGICDNLATTTIMATEAPVYFFPNMGQSMFNKKVIQNNMDLLVQMGYYVYSEKSEGFSIGRSRYEYSITLPTIGQFEKIMQEHTYSIERG